MQRRAKKAKTLFLLSPNGVTCPPSSTRRRSKGVRGTRNYASVRAGVGQAVYPPAACSRIGDKATALAGGLSHLETSPHDVLVRGAVPVGPAGRIVV